MMVPSIGSALYVAAAILFPAVWPHSDSHENLGLQLTTSEASPLAYEEVQFDRVGREFDGPVVGAECLVTPTCSCEKVGADGMVWLVVVEGASVDLGKRRQPLGRTVELRDCHRSA